MTSGRTQFFELEGGPFDGYEGSLDPPDQLPNRWWAFTDDDAVIVTTDQRRGAEPYDRDREKEDGTVIYVHADIDLTPGLQTETRELIHA